MNEDSKIGARTRASVVDALHGLLQEEKVSIGAERRRSVRRAYEYVQLLAFYDGLNSPAQADFRAVLFHDLAPGGFSFYTDKTPTDSFVIVALGGIPFSFFLAKILRVRRSEIEGDQRQIVSCCFLRRITTPSDLRRPN